MQGPKGRQYSETLTGRLNTHFTQSKGIAGVLVTTAHTLHKQGRQGQCCSTAQVASSTQRHCSAGAVAETRHRGLVWYRAKDGQLLAHRSDAPVIPMAQHPAQLTHITIPHEYGMYVFISAVGTAEDASC